MAHSKPVAPALTRRTCRAEPIVSFDAVFTPLPTAKSPTASHIVSVATSPPPPPPEGAFQLAVVAESALSTQPTVNPDKSNKLSSKAVAVRSAKLSIVDKTLFIVTIVIPSLILPYM